MCMRICIRVITCEMYETIVLRIYYYNGKYLCYEHDTVTYILVAFEV